MAAQTRRPSLRTRLRDSDTVFLRMLGGCLNRWVLLALVVGVLLFSVANRDAIEATFWQHVGKYCGTLDHGPDDPSSAAAVPQVTSCFTHAYATCQAASLDYSIVFVDSSTHYVFIVEPGLGRCNLVLQETDKSANFGGSFGTAVVHCGGVINDSGRLRFWSCGQFGDLWIPTP